MPVRTSNTSTETACLVGFHKICLQHEKRAGIRRTCAYRHKKALLALICYEFRTSLPCQRPNSACSVSCGSVKHRRSSVSGRSSTVLEQSARQRHVSQFVVDFPAATETHTVPAVIPGYYYVTFLNCNTHSALSSDIAT